MSSALGSCLTCKRQRGKKKKRLLQVDNSEKSCSSRRWFALSLIHTQTSAPSLQHAVSCCVLVVCWLTRSECCSVSGVVTPRLWAKSGLFDGKPYTSVSEEILPFLIMCAVYLERLCKYWVTLLVSYCWLFMQLVMTGKLLGWTARFISEKNYQ